MILSRGKGGQMKRLISVVLVGFISANIGALESNVAINAKDLVKTSGIVAIPDKEIEQALVAQVRLELESSHAYEARAQYAKSKGYDGMANWFSLQAKEEREHAQKVMQHLMDAGKMIKEIPTLSAISTQFNSVEELFLSSLQREKQLSDVIKKIKALSLKKEDFYTSQLMDWFVVEQIEEEKLFADVLDKMSHYLKSNDYAGFDKYLATRQV